MTCLALRKLIVRQYLHTISTKGPKSFHISRHESIMGGFARSTSNKRGHDIAFAKIGLHPVIDSLMAPPSTKTTMKAAARLGLSQPAISHSLNRLRDLLKDRLFVRASRGVIPTPKALAIESTVKELLERAEKVFFEPPAFNPKTAKMTFRIATTDYFEQVALPPILKRIQIDAPHITLISRPTGGYLPAEGLEKGEYDLAIAGFYKDVPNRFFKQKLYADDFVFVAHKNKRLGKGPLTYEQYAKQKHIIISPHGDLKTQSKELMRKQGYDIHYSVAVTGFLSPARILSMTDLSLTCPRRLAQSYLEFFPLKIYELPFKIPTMSVVQVWHERQQDSAEHRWLRQLFHEICSTQLDQY